MAFDRGLYWVVFGLGFVLFIVGLIFLFFVGLHPMYSGNFTWADGRSGAEHARDIAPYIAAALGVGSVLLGIGLSGLQEV